jgi:pantothenate kinase
VGGTLAKLVYFEQKSEQSYDSESVLSHHHLLLPRERHYRASASAKAVLLARRGGGFDLSEEDDDEHDNDHEPEETLNGEKENKGQLGGSAGKSKSYRQRSLSVSEQRLRRASLSPSRRSSVNGRRSKPATAAACQSLARHSDDSNEDLKSLYDLRVESVPDDLNAYARTVLERGWREPQHYHTTETMDECRSNLSSETSAAEASLMMRKSRSMLNFSNGRTEALDRFYSFARRLDSYREGVKDHKLSFYSRQLGGEFHFIRFESRRMQNAMDLIRANQLHLNIREMGATGGGAHRFAAQWESELGICMKKQDELDSLVAGMQFVLTTVVGECYTFRPTTDARSSFSSQSSVSSSSPPPADHHPVGAPLNYEDENGDSDGRGGSEDRDERTTRARTAAPPRLKVDEWWWSRKVQRDAITGPEYPYLLVTIGTGVSILRVDGPRRHKRVSGSTIGGGTYWGLIRLLTDLEDFDAVLRLAERGDPTKVDMMVGDIYGNSDVVEKMGLSSDLVASSFGKLVAKDDPASGLKEEDLARALLLMITINIGQVAYLNAQLHKTSRIYFVGNFLRENKISQRRLAFAIDYWSKGEMEALFLEHEGYFGALGAFLLSQGISQQAAVGSARLYSRASIAVGSGGDSPLPRLHKRSETIGSL